MSLPQPKDTFMYCRGESPEGTQVCGYRNQCKRYLPNGYDVFYKPYWQGGDDCPQYVSKSNG
jgi:hypothetical protein